MLWKNRKLSSIMSIVECEPLYVREGVEISCLPYRRKWIDLVFGWWNDKNNWHL